MHKELANELELETFREIRTLSVASGSKGQKKGLEQTMWLDGNISQARLMDDKTAQVTPLEITTKLMEAAKGRGAEVVIGRATGVEFRDVVEGKGDEEGGRRAWSFGFLGGTRPPSGARTSSWRRGSGVP